MNRINKLYIIHSIRFKLYFLFYPNFLKNIFIILKNESKVLLKKQKIMRKGKRIKWNVCFSIFITNKRILMQIFPHVKCQMSHPNPSPTSTYPRTCPQLYFKRKKKLKKALSTKYKISSRKTAESLWRICRRTAQNRSYPTDKKIPRGRENKKSWVSFARVISVIIYRNSFAQNEVFNSCWPL